MAKENENNGEDAGSFIAWLIFVSLAGLYIFSHPDEMNTIGTHLPSGLVGGGNAPQAGLPDSCAPFAHDHIQSIAAVGYHFTGQDTMSCEAFAAALQKGRNGVPSPAAAYAPQLYAMLRERGFDPGAALATFTGESQMGTNGVGGPAKNWGNMRTSWNNQENLPTLGPDAVFPSWEDGLKNWMDMVQYYESTRHTTSVEAILRIITPSSPYSGFINTVESLMRQFNDPSAAFDPNAVADIASKIKDES